MASRTKHREVNRWDEEAGPAEALRRRLVWVAIQLMTAAEHVDTDDDASGTVELALGQACTGVAAIVREMAPHMTSPVVRQMVLRQVGGAA